MQKKKKKKKRKEKKRKLSVFCHMSQASNVRLVVCHFANYSDHRSDCVIALLMYTSLPGKHLVGGIKV